jgi:murein DD-endopeptidase MepM/ murein hydrolase activator NlpD
VVGERLRAGDAVGRIGTRAENGGWAPHLHFQLLVSHLGQRTAVHSVAARSQLDRWRTISPDPNLILRIPGLRPAM